MPDGTCSLRRNHAYYYQVSITAHVIELMRLSPMTYKISTMAIISFTTSIHLYNRCNVNCFVLGGVTATSFCGPQMTYMLSVCTPTKVSGRAILRRLNISLKLLLCQNSLEDSFLEHPLSIRVLPLPWLLLQCHLITESTVGLLVKALWRSARSCTATAEGLRRVTWLDVITETVSMSGFI